MKLILLTLLSSVLLAAGYPSGAPDDSCATFRPFHVNRTTGQPFNALNDNDDGTGPSDVECPYQISYSRKFTPGQPITLTISTKSSNDYFRGFMLSIVSQETDETGLSQFASVGEFNSSAKTICGGSTATHSNGDRRTSEQLVWTAPANASRQTFDIWLTVAKSYSRYWVQCADIDLPAIDAEETSATTTPHSITTTRVNSPNGPDILIPKEDTRPFNKEISILSGINNNNKHSNRSNQNHGHGDHGKDGHTNADGKDHDHVGRSSSDEDQSALVREEDSLVSTSSEDINSEGKDESGNSNENSVDISDNRSGSSLNSDEKETRRQKYLKKGIDNFDTDIKQFLKGVGKSHLLGKGNSASMLTNVGLVLSVILGAVLAVVV